MDKVRLEIAQEVTVARIPLCNSKALRGSFRPSSGNVAYCDDFNLIQLCHHRKMFARNSPATYQNAS
jgi:hypothetical protein